MEPIESYRHVLRVRVCGILIEESRLLLVRMRSPVTDTIVWMPPGGGLEFGESIESCLIREFKEETGLVVKPQELQFVNELIQHPFHALELYYQVIKTGGQLQLGSDPEQNADSQLLEEVKWVPLSELTEIPLAPDRLRKHLSVK